MTRLPLKRTLGVSAMPWQLTYCQAFNSDARRTYYLSAPWRSDDINRFEYSATFVVKGGSTVIFESDGGDTQSGIYNLPISFRNERRQTCSEVPTSCSQFVHV